MSEPKTRPLSDRLPDYEMARHEEIKDALKEAIREWLDEKLAEVGKWTMRGVFSMAFALLVYAFIHFGMKP